MTVWMPVTIIIAAIGLVLVLPVISDLLSCLVAGVRRAEPHRSTEPARLLFVVPAHDEELLIGSCLDSFNALQYPRADFHVVVVADNCTDGTASVTRSYGYDCLERFDEARRGKPHAIAWSLERLPLADYDALIIVDADTVVAPDFAARLATAMPLDGKAIQAWHDVSNPGDSALTVLGEVFAAGRYRFGFALKQHAGLNVPIMGNGMCFGTAVLRRHGWQAYSICEDWEQYALLTENGVAIEYVPGLRVFSQEARSLDQSASQRKRWTAGKLFVMHSLAPRILSSPLISRRQKLDAIAELAAPGPVAHAAFATLLSVPAYFAPAAAWLLALIWLPIVRHGIYAIGGIASVRQPGRAAVAFLYLPFYAVWRLGIQLASLTMVGAQPWVRTRRHKPTAAENAENPVEVSNG